VQRKSIGRGAEERKTRSAQTQRNLWRNEAEEQERHRDELRQLNGDISKSVRRDVRQYNTNQVTTVIEENKSLRVLRRSVAGGKKNIYKLADHQGQITSNRDENIPVSKTVLRFP